MLHRLAPALLLCALAASACSSQPGDSRDTPVPPKIRVAESKGWPLVPLSKAGLDEEAARLKRMLGPDFVVRVQSPFVIAGDISAARMERLSRHTIGDCHKALKKGFFTKHEPTHVLRVFLFKDKKSYTEGAQTLFGHTPGSPYGYYVPSKRNLIMNIGTGGGTLVHEMVHALRNYDFPGAPTWLDEGVASLFEQCTIRDGRIVGLVNWRLPVLADGFHDGSYISLARLLALTEDEFRGENASMHYAESRYLCMYLQEKGLLRDVYRTFRDGFGKDPTGRLYVEQWTGQKLEDLEKDWLDWVGTLRWR